MNDPGDMCVFAYGTLMCSGIMARVTGHTAPGYAAMLPGFRRRQVRGASYPGIVPDLDEGVWGLLFYGVSAEMIRRLDEYEGSMYSRQQATTMLDDDRSETAQVYVVRPEYLGALSGDDWDYDEFLQYHRAAFLRSEGWDE